MGFNYASMPGQPTRKVDLVVFCNHGLIRHSAEQFFNAFIKIFVTFYRIQRHIW